MRISGWGSIAGPLVVTAAAATEEGMRSLVCRDSKKYSSINTMARDAARDRENAVIATVVVMVNADTLCARGYDASRKWAFQLAVHKLRQRLSPRYPEAIIDGSLSFGVPYSRAIPKADDLYRIVSYASCTGKVRQKNIMCQASKEFPEYKFDSNAGYASQHHLMALQKFGGIPGFHRMPVIAKMARSHGWQLKTREDCECVPLVDDYCTKLRPQGLSYLEGK